MDVVTASGIFSLFHFFPFFDSESLPSQISRVSMDHYDRKLCKYKLKIKRRGRLQTPVRALYQSLNNLLIRQNSDVLHACINGNACVIRVAEDHDICF